MRNLGKLEKLLSLAIASGYLKEKKKISVLVSAKAGLGKSDTLKRFVENPYTYTINQVTRFGLASDLLPMFKSGMKINHIILPAFEAIIDAQHFVSSDIIQFISAITEEGIYKIKTYNLDYSFNPPVQCGILTATTDLFLNRKKAFLKELGFLSRFVLFSYDFSELSRKEIEEDIKNGCNIENSKIVVPSFPPNSIIACNPRHLDEFEYVVKILEDSKLSIYTRVYDNLRILLKASALINNRNEVTTEDVKLLHSLTPYMNLNYVCMSDE